MSFVKSAWDRITGKDAAEDAAKASREAAQTQAQWQLDALDYLKETEEVPQQLREGALQGLGGLYGLEGGTGTQQALIDRAKQSPLYNAIMGGQEAGEEAILRRAGATGGLRSGNVQQNLYDYNTRLQNQALLESYGQQVRGLEGLAFQVPSNANTIAQQTSGIGRTFAQGDIASAQSLQQGQQGEMDTIMSLGKFGLGTMFSDRRLKKNIQPKGQIGGHNWYTWEWNEKAEQELGLFGESHGVMAEEVQEKMPEAVSEMDGYLVVDYGKLGVNNG